MIKPTKKVPPLSYWLNKLFLWLNINRLSLNIDKTNFLIFHPFNKPMKNRITIKINKQGNSGKKIKYLGILIDSTLSWKHQISNISKKISQAIGIMYKLRPFLPMKVMKDVYYSLVYSHILYAIDLGKLLILQKRALRLMTYNDVYPTVPGPLISSVPIFVRLGILKITDIYKYQVSKFIFECINKLAPKFSKPV